MTYPVYSVFSMCPRPGSNRHVDHSTWDFKSQASANSATPAGDFPFRFRYSPCTTEGSRC